MLLVHRSAGVLMMFSSRRFKRACRLLLILVALHTVHSFDIVPPPQPLPQQQQQQAHLYTPPVAPLVSPAAVPSPSSPSSTLPNPSTTSSSSVTTDTPPASPPPPPPFATATASSADSNSADAESKRRKQSNVRYQSDQAPMSPPAPSSSTSPASSTPTSAPPSTGDTANPNRHPRSNGGESAMTPPNPTWYMIFVLLLVSFAPLRRFLFWGMGRYDELIQKFDANRKRLRAKKSLSEDNLTAVQVDRSAKSSLSTSFSMTAVTNTKAPVAIEMSDFSSKPRMIPNINTGMSVNCILNEALILKITAVLPGPVNIMDWKLLYNSYDHGQNLLTFYRRVSRAGPTLLICRDSNRFIFGAYISQSWNPANSSYFGTGDSFVLTIVPEFNVYRWSNANSYFALAKPDSMAVGGGDHFALWLDVNLRKGSSMNCQTYDSPCLASQPDFECFGVEAWGFT